MTDNPFGTCDYHQCDFCGERKTFYDADMEVEWVNESWRYGGKPGYKIMSLCHECEKTHEIVIRPKALT